ncbi:hypothetical protein [Streptomyces sp. NPDC059883]|uniref:hypothetical protein n=1 Tax=unclassified Streptomyces TaxID=2593676 RepID=UPI00365FB24F
MNACQLCVRPLEDGYLCLGCTKSTRVRLECLPDLYEGLAAFLAPMGGSPQVRGSRPVFAPLPVSEDVLDLRGPGGLAGVAERWVAIIREQRGMRLPNPAGSVGGRLKTAVSELLGHLPWVAVSWSDAGMFAADIREVTRSVASILAPPAPIDRGTRIGTCPAEVENGEICGAVLRLYASAKVVTCEWCSTAYPPAMWPGLKVLMDTDTKAATTMGQADVAAALPQAAAGTTR